MGGALLGDKMARTRLLHPGFFSDEKVISVPALHRILFQGLWILADREGRLEEKPVEIKIRVLPMDDCDISAMLTVLAAAGLILRYKIGAKSYIAIPNFLRHQKPHQREVNSDIPPPQRAETTEAQPRHGSSTTKVQPEHNLGRVEPGVSVSNSVSKGGTNAASAAPPEPLRERMDAVWFERHGVPYSWSFEDEQAMRPALQKASGNPNAVLDRWRAAVFWPDWPQCGSVKDLVKHWNRYGAKQQQQPDKTSNQVRL